MSAWYEAEPGTSYLADDALAFQIATLDSLDATADSLGCTASTDGVISGLIHGYITIDMVNYCNLSDPTDSNYFYNDAIGMENNLWGEIIFTSGATADPKGVVITHRNILANIVPIEREMARRVLAGIQGTRGLLGDPGPGGMSGDSAMCRRPRWPGSAGRYAGIRA